MCFINTIDEEKFDSSRDLFDCDCIPSYCTNGTTIIKYDHHYDHLYLIKIQLF